MAKPDQRPWIDISKINVAENIDFDENGARVSVSFELSNVGKSPAFNVMPWISAFVQPFVSANSPAEPLGELYPMPSASIRVPAENIAFPNRSVTRTVTGYGSRKRVEQAVVATRVRLFPLAANLTRSPRCTLRMSRSATWNTANAMAMAA